MNRRTCSLMYFQGFLFNAFTSFLSLIIVRSTPPCPTSASCTLEMRSYTPGGRSTSLSIHKSSSSSSCTWTRALLVVFLTNNLLQGRTYSGSSSPSRSMSREAWSATTLSSPLIYSHLKSYSCIISFHLFTLALNSLSI